MSEIDQRQTEQKPTQEFAIITKAKDLVKHTFMMTSERRFPKKYRFTIVNRLHDLTLDIFQHIQEANELDLTDPQEYRERRYEQQKALTECKTGLFLIELSFEQELISSEQCAEWTRHVMNVKNMTAKWRKQDRERGAALQQKRGITPRRERPEGCLGGGTQRTTSKTSAKSITLERRKGTTLTTATTAFARFGGNRD